MTITILAVGADGRFASLVIPALTSRGTRVRGLIRDPAKADAVRASGAAEVAVGDLREPASMARALEGVASVFYIAPAFLPGEAEVGKALVAAAIKAGVSRLVFSSVIHPVLSGLKNHAEKAPVEEAVLDSDLRYSFLHPTLFFQNYAGSCDRIGRTGVVAEPWSSDTRFSRVKASMPARMLEAQIEARAIPREEVGEDLVGTVFFLASPDADFMSGQTLNVDGGKHML